MIQNVSYILPHLWKVPNSPTKHRMKVWHCRMCIYPSGQWGTTLFNCRPLATSELVKCQQGFFQTYCIQCIIKLCVAAALVGHIWRATGCCHCFGQYLPLDASMFGSKSNTHVSGVSLFTQEKTWKLSQTWCYLKLSLYKVCAVLGYFTAYSGNSLWTFWDKLLVPPARVKKPKKSKI